MTKQSLGLVLPYVDIDHVDNPWLLARAGLIGTILLVCAIGVWVSLAPLHGAVIAPGVVKVDLDRRTVQHQEGGIVGAILVRNGAKVSAGQTLIVLKDVRVDASNDLVQTQLDAELAKEARLRAEQTWAKDIVFPDELTSRRADPRIAELVSREYFLFRTRREAYDAQVALIKAQIAETQSEVAALNMQIAAASNASRLQKEELAQNEGLVPQGYVSKTRIITLRRNAAELEAQRAENEAELSRARQKISDLRLRAESLRSTFMQDAASELRTATAQTFGLRERLRPTQDAGERLRITAPISGEVVDLKVNTIGQVIGPREPIMEIVPENADLIVEARVRPQDINYVRSSVEADVRLTAFRQRVTPTVQGTVIYVSADRLVDRQSSEPYYVSHVRVTAESLASAGNLRLRAGMPAEVFIRTPPRTALQYFVDPISGFLQRSMREP